MKESRTWTQEVAYKLCQEDRVLRQLREQRGMKKWSQISLTMELEFEMAGKSGKRCRERYFNYASSLVKRDDWSSEEEKSLFRLHNQKGNKWMQIAKQLERPDNAVKNHYHSKLRKALRKVNKLIYEYLRNDFKSIKNSILPKILQTAEDYYSQADKSEATVAKRCFDMKNAILSYLELEEEKISQKDITKLREMVKEANYFNKTYKKKKNKRESTKRIRCNQYKGKEILKLINENKKNQQQDIVQDANQSSQESSSFSSSRIDEVSSINENCHVEKVENQIYGQKDIVDESVTFSTQCAFTPLQPLSFPYPFRFPMQLMLINPFPVGATFAYPNLMNFGVVQKSHSGDENRQA